MRMCECCMQRMATSVKTSQGEDRLRSTSSDVVRREQVSNSSRKRERGHGHRTHLKILEPMKR